MRAVQEFSRFANQYDSYNIIQTKVAEQLIRMLEKDSYPNIADIGCGSGAVYKELVNQDIGYRQFYALDFSAQMLEHHPDSVDVTKILFDFNDSQSFIHLPIKYFDLVISASALQWSNSLEQTLRKVSQLSDQFYFAIFTANTFMTLHKIAGITSPIFSEEKIIQSINISYDASFKKVSYQLKFENVRKMFEYIKKSGVSGGKRKLGFRALKCLMDEYPYDYLEFEVLFVKAVSKK